MTDQSVVRSEKEINETAVTPSKLEQVMVAILQDIKRGNRKLSTISSEDEKWNLWDVLVHELNEEDCSPEVLQSYRRQVKQYLLDSLRDAGFTGEVCKDCLDPLDMHENSDHVPSILDTKYHEPEFSTPTDLQLVRQLHAKEREDFRVYCLKRASYHSVRGNFALMIGGFIFVLPYIIWSAVPSDVYWAFAQKTQESAYAWVDRIRGFINL